jgi:hypothetical protein
MTVQKLIETLLHFDLTLPVGVLHDNGVMAASEVGMYEGDFLNLPPGNKMILKREHTRFIIIGNPGDFEEPAYHDNCKPIQIEDVYE